MILPLTAAPGEALRSVARSASVRRRRLPDPTAATATGRADPRCRALGQRAVALRVSCIRTTGGRAAAWRRAPSRVRSRPHTTHPPEEAKRVVSPCLGQGGPCQLCAPAARAARRAGFLVSYGITPILPSLGKIFGVFGCPAPSVATCRSRARCENSRNIRERSDLDSYFVRASDKW